MVYTIAEIADIHFGCNTQLTSRLYNELEEEFIGTLKTEKPDIIAICGDMFDQKLMFTTFESQLSNKFIHVLRTEFPDALIILVKGTRSHDLNQLDNFKGYVDEKFRIYNEVTEDYYKDFRFLVIPEEYFPDKSVYDKYLNTNEKYDWVFFHGMFSFAGAYALNANNRFNKITFTVEDFKNCVFGKVVGGHIHDPVESGNVQYCGSFERWKHGENLTKGFRIHKYDSKTKKVIDDRFIPNKSCQKFETISVNEFNLNDVEILTKEISEKSKGLTNLRIKIGKLDEVSQEQIKNLIGSISQFNNVVLFKEPKLATKNNTDEAKRESEQRRKLMSEYDGLTFNQITLKYASEVLGKHITESEIAEVLS